MPFITLLLASLYLLAIYCLLFLIGYMSKEVFSQPKDAR